MSRLKYFNFIEEKLNFLAYRIEVRGGLNILDLHLHSEDIFICTSSICFSIGSFRTLILYNKMRQVLI
ncbi:MAG: SMEK domain-containing protein [bacterium]